MVSYFDYQYNLGNSHCLIVILFRSHFCMIIPLALGIYCHRSSYNNLIAFNNCKETQYFVGLRGCQGSCLGIQHFDWLIGGKDPT